MTDIQLRQVDDHIYGYSDGMAYDRRTGEAFPAEAVIYPEGTKHITPAQQEAINAAKAHRNTIEQMKAQTRRTSGNSGFVFVSANGVNDGMKPETIARVIYLSTYLSYDNGILIGAKGKPIMKNDLEAVMKLKRNTIARMLDDAQSILHIHSDGRIELDNSVFMRGTLPKDHEYFYRVYISNVRRLYRSTPQSQHKQLGYVFAMLRYLNIEYNVLCHNPEATAWDDIERMTLAEFCQKIHYNENNLNRLRAIYRQIIFDISGRKQRFCSFVSDGGSWLDAEVFVNPNIVYSGTQLKKVEILGEFCKIKD